MSGGGGSVWEEESPPTEFGPAGAGASLLIVAGVAGILSRTATAPLDRIKVLRQVHGYRHANSSTYTAVSWMIQEGGYLSLWRGNGVNVLKIGPETALKYSSYAVYKHLLCTDKAEEDHLPFVKKLLAGACAGATAQTVVYPLEVLKTRMCLRKTGQYSGIVTCAKAVLSEGGIRGFGRGYYINMVGILPYAGLELAAYDTSRKWLTNHHWFKDDSPTSPPLGVALICGSLSSALGITCCYPLALLRTKMQSKSHFSQPQHNTARGLASTIWKVEGFIGFYRGLGANLCKVLPSVAICYATFEVISHYYDIVHHPFTNNNIKSRRSSNS